MDSPESLPNKNSKLQFSFDFRLIVIILLIIIAGMLALWRPWSPPQPSNARTIEVTGDAKLTAVPDEYVFNPSYEIKGTTSKAALVALSKKSDEIIAKLKSLGVADSKIKTGSNGYDNGYYPLSDPGMDSQTYTLTLTITINDRDLAQKVQDYLITTSPTGAVSPQADFSETKRKDLETKARDQATKDARSKADQSAKNLGFRIGKVKTVSDNSGFGGPVRCGGGLCAESNASLDTTSTKLAVQPGENDLQYSVTVTYYVR